MTQTFSEGDLVEAVKGEQAIRGRLINTDSTKSPRWHALHTAHDDADKAIYIEWMKTQGWKFTLIEKAAPPLPTEPGWYLSNGGGDTVYLGVDGSWSDDRNYGVNPGEIARKHAPLTRLEPVGVTAKKVLDRVRTGLLSTTFRDSLLGIEALNAAVVRTDLNNIAAEFGVTS